MWATFNFSNTTHINPSSHSYYFTMPMQSCILAPPFFSSSEIIPFNPVSNTSVLHGILKSSFLTMMLKHPHIHPISEINNFHSLDFDLTNRIWCILKDLSHSIHKATDPTLNPFKALPSELNRAHLREIEMSSPPILQIENFPQNMLLCATTCKEIHWLFRMVQTIGMESLEWIAEAKRWCGMIGRAHSWHWVVNEGVDSDQFPALEGQSLLLNTELELSDLNVLILHPRLWTQLPDNILMPPPAYDPEIHLTEIRCWVLISGMQSRLGGYVVNILIYSPYLSLYYSSDIFSPTIIYIILF